MSNPTQFQPHLRNIKSGQYTDNDLGCIVKNGKQIPISELQKPQAGFLSENFQFNVVKSQPLCNILGLNKGGDVDSDIRSDIGDFGGSQHGSDDEDYDDIDTEQFRGAYGDYDVEIHGKIGDENQSTLSSIFSKAYTQEDLDQLGDIFFRPSSATPTQEFPGFPGISTDPYPGNAKDLVKGYRHLYGLKSFQSPLPDNIEPSAKPADFVINLEGLSLCQDDEDEETMVKDKMRKQKQ
ncbi:hypothetical protein H4219_005316 [Mycoemilia scoparia]|uniref:Uncharacterized protein n=1 Tax=Mycoemilia scoparia TaxID=417184 RepID=A0A9W8DK30_9FUNG|nr:hypothetical protein H4219_005316 [Mycoemilia scoparia]